MSLISEQVDSLRRKAKMFNDEPGVSNTLNHAADTIEELSNKLARANMERSELYYNGMMNDDCIGKQALIKAIHDSGLLENISRTEFYELMGAIDSVPVVGVLPVVRCKDCRQWGTGFPAETESVKCCQYAGYMVGANGYCVCGEKK